MFTGIIETMAKVQKIQQSGDNFTFVLESEIAPEFRPDESVSHNGVCLTVEQVEGQKHQYQVTAIPETLSKSMLGDLKEGSVVNLERAMPAGGRLDGHFVQGHVDSVGTIRDVRALDGSFEFDIQYAAEHEGLVVPMGSICIDGISLTIARTAPADHTVTVCIIPHTFQKTNVSSWQKGSRVNLEFDVLGKYVNKIMGLRDGGK